MDYASGEYLYKLVSANIWSANYAATELLFLDRPQFLHVE